MRFRYTFWVNQFGSTHRLHGVLSLKILCRQMVLLTLANMATRYRNTYSGFFWVVLSPVLMFGAQAYAFHYVLHIEIEKFLLFLLSGLIPWIFLTQATEMGAPLIVNNGRLLKSFPVHPLMLIAVQITDNFINFIAAFLVLFMPIAWLSGAHWESIFYAPLGLVLLLIGGIGMASLISLLNVRYRDAKFVISFVNGFSFFITPIFYGEHFVPSQFHWAFAINPYYQILLPFRQAFVAPGGEGFWLQFFVSFLWTAGICGAAILYWRKMRNEIYFSL